MIRARARLLPVALLAILLAGPPGAHASTAPTGLGARVLPTRLSIDVAVPGRAVRFGALARGGATATATATVRVRSSLPRGYLLLVARTAFRGGDLPLRAGVVAASPGATVDVGPAAPVPTVGTLQLGHRIALPSPRAGDLWRLRLVLGPAPCTAPLGDRAAALTVVAQGTGRRASTALAVTATVRSGAGCRVTPGATVGRR